MPQKRTGTLISYKNMVQRCTNPKNTAYHRYGGRGITICEAWRGPGGFAQFVKDMGERPAGMTLDRIDNDGPYAPENCRWASRAEQAFNRPGTWRLEWKGRLWSMSALARAYGIPQALLRTRIKVKGWPLDKALYEPVPRPVTPWWRLSDRAA
jgi:hypothetical protein